MEYTFTLSKNLVYEHQLTMAYRNSKMHATNIKLMISIAAFAVLLWVIIFKFTILTLIISVISSTTIFLLFPRYYWNRVGAKITETIDNQNLKFNPVIIKLTDKIEVVYDNQLHLYSYQQIKDVIFTKSLTIVQVISNNQIESLLIPLSVVSDELDEFLSLIGKGEANCEAK